MKWTNHGCMLGLWLVVVLGTPVAGHASLYEVAVYTPIIPMDLRSRALGEANVALPNAAFAADVNPALLLETDRWNLGYGAGAWLPILRADYTLRAFYGAVGPGTLSRNAGSRIAFGFGYKRLTRNPETVEWVATASGAIGLSTKANLGASVKWIESSLGYLGDPVPEASSWAVDLGFYISGLLRRATVVDEQSWVSDSYFWRRMQIPRDPGVSLGVSVQNLGPGMRFFDAGSSDPLPRVANVGVSYRPYDTETLGLLLVSQLQQSLVAWDDFFADGQFSVGWGAELSVVRLVDLRLGFVHLGGGNPDRLSLGLGLGFERIRVDYYRVQSESSPLHKTDMWSLTIRW